MTIHTSGFVCSWNIGAGYVDISAYVLAIDGDFSTQNAGNGIGFGDSSQAACTITIDPNATGTPLSLTTLALVPIKVQFTVDANTAYGGAGVIVDWQQTQDTIELHLTGFQKLISTVRVYSPLFYRRPIATATTGSSIEDPTSGSYAGGALNFVLWSAGGRPYEQSGTYPTATFYYSLSQAPIAPKYSWVAGEDGWAEALRLVVAAGGQLYQRPDGVIQYTSALSLAGGSSVFALDIDSFGSISRKGSAADVVAAFTCEFVPRFPAGLQAIVSDTAPRVVAVGQTLTIELVPQYPIVQGSLETAGGGGTQLLAEAISATSYDGTQIVQGSGYTHTLTVTAQRIVLTITNAGTLPFTIERITLRGVPLVPGEAGTVTIGSGNPTQTIAQSAYIQSRSHAQRLARMALAFYSVPRPIITASGVLYNPTLQIGMAGTLTVSEWGLSSAPVAILGMQHSETGATVDLDLVETSGLPAMNSYFKVSASSQSGLTKLIGY